MRKINALTNISTPRLTIRPIALGDEVPLNNAINHSLKQLQEWQSWAKDPSLDATTSFVQRGVMAWKSANTIEFPMVMVHKQDQKIIGASGYNERSMPANGLYEIGYWCDIGYQGNGYVTESVNALTRYALEALNAHQVVMRIATNNVKSIAVAKRLHFTNEGEQPSTTQQDITDYFFTCTHTQNLPPLAVSWCHS